MKTTSKHRLGTVKNAQPFFGEVILEIETKPNFEKSQIVEGYQGIGFQSQGYPITVPDKGYDSWKKGIKKGIDYGLKMLSDERKFKITILECTGLVTSTNPIILAFVASRALLNKIDNNESKAELNKLEEAVFSSWNYKPDSQLNFENFIIDEN